MKKSVVLAAIAALLMTLPVAAQKFAYVNTDYILENIPEYKDAQKNLDAISIGWQKEVENKYTEIDKMYKSYQAEQILLTEDMKKKREQEIVNKEKEVKDLQKQRFGQGGDLFKKRQELVKPIQDKVYNTVKKLATDGSYMVIFDKAGDGVNMLYANAKYDKSDDVLNMMGIKPSPKSTVGKGTGSDSKSGGGATHSPSGGDSKPSEGKSPDRQPGQDAQPTSPKSPK